MMWEPDFDPLAAHQVSKATARALELVCQSRGYLAVHSAIPTSIMHRSTLPNEITDQILENIHPLRADLLDISTPSAWSPDQRHKSNHERLLRGPTLVFRRKSRSIYKELRFVFPEYYTRALFQTVYLLSRQQNFQNADAISRTRLAHYVQSVVIYLPSHDENINPSCPSPEWQREQICWRNSSLKLLDLLNRFPNLRSVAILPSWYQASRTSEAQVELPHINRQGVPAWVCEAKSHDVETLMCLLGLLRKLDGQIGSLHIFNLGTEWLPFMASGRVGSTPFVPLSPATAVSMRLNSQNCITKLSLHSCSLHDMIWFTPIFTQLEVLSLENTSARHPAEVDLFATTFDNSLFPKVRCLIVCSSDLQPNDYVSIFEALRRHRSLDKVVFKSIHRYCVSSTVGHNFDFNSLRPEDAIQRLLCRFMQMEDVASQFRVDWLKMFRDSGQL